MTRRAGLKTGLMPGMIGAVAMIAQVAYLRFVAQSFYGNELTMSIALGHWLVWTGFGSLLGTKLVQRKPAEKHLLALMGLYGLTLIVFAGLLFLNRTIAGIPAGEVVGLGTIFGWTFLFFSLPALLNGLFFPLIVDWNRRQAVAAPVHAVYAAEVIGSAIGSLAFAGLIILGVNTFNCLLVIVWLMLMLALRLFLKSNKSRSWAVAGTFVFIVAAMFIFNKKLTVIKWQPFQSVVARESPHSSLTTVRYNEAFSIYSDSQPLWTFGERAQAEELTHFALLNHPNPENVLVVGLGNAEICREIRRHPSVRQITILQPDRILQQTLHQIAPFVIADSTIRVVISDPALFLKRTVEHFDVVLLNIPLPVNAQWNRFYTREFLASVRRCVGENGLLMLNFPGDEEFLTAAQVEFLKTMQNTARNVFRETTWIPGLTTHLLAADFPLTNDLRLLIDTQKARDIAPLYVGEYFLNDRLSPWKIDFLIKQIDACQVKEVNTLARPVGYYYDTTLWGQRTGGLIKKIYPIFKRANSLLILIGFAIVMVVFRLIVRRKTSLQIAGKMASVGFWVMGLETVAIILFQSLVGSVYLGIVFLTFFYMLGSGLGAIAERKHPGKEIPHSVRFIMILLPAGCLLPLPFAWPAWIVTILIGLILLTGGFLAGFLFPVLVRNYTEQSGRREAGAGRIYAADILGSALGVYLISGIVIPVWGIIPAVGMVSAVAVVICWINKIYV